MELVSTQPQTLETVVLAVRNVQVEILVKIASVFVLLAKRLVTVFAKT